MVGAYGEASADVHTLLKLAEAKKAEAVAAEPSAGGVFTLDRDRVLEVGTVIKTGKISITSLIMMQEP